MNEGWIKLHRKFSDWEWYDSTTMVCFFIHLLMDANYKDKKWHGEIIKRGSFIMSVLEYGKPMDLSHQQTRTIIERLKSTNEITIKTTNKYTIIIINNYDLYQDNNKQDNKQITNNQQTNNKQITTTKELKNIRKKERKKTHTIARVENCLENLNEDFYKKKALEFIYSLYTDKDKNGNDLWDKQLRGNWDKVIIVCSQYLKVYSKEDFENLLLAYDNYCISDSVKRKIIMKLENWIKEWRNFL